MILTAAMEFHPANSKMVKDRPSDDAELNEVCVCVCGQLIYGTVM